MTLGEYMVGLDFNPANDVKVTQIKRSAAQWIDFLDQFSQKDELSPEGKKLCKLAQRKVEDAAMWSVKAVTKKPRT